MHGHTARSFHSVFAAPALFHGLSCPAVGVRLPFRGSGGTSHALPSQADTAGDSALAQRLLHPSPGISGWAQPHVYAHAGERGERRQSFVLLPGAGAGWPASIKGKFPTRVSFLGGCLAPVLALGGVEACLGMGATPA